MSINSNLNLVRAALLQLPSQEDREKLLPAFYALYEQLLALKHENNLLKYQLYIIRSAASPELYETDDD